MGVSIIIVMVLGLIILYYLINLIYLELRSNPPWENVSDLNKVVTNLPRIVPVGQEFGSCSLFGWSLKVGLANDNPVSFWIQGLYFLPAVDLVWEKHYFRSDVYAINTFVEKKSLFTVCCIIR